MTGPDGAMSGTLAGNPSSANAPAGAGDPVLSVRGLTTSFLVDGAWRTVVRDVSFDVMPGETVAIVGESGSGKSVTSLSVMRLLARGSSRIEGSIVLNGRDILALSDKQMRQVRGKDAAMIFQEPMTSLNPVFTIGRQISEALTCHGDITRAEARAQTVQLLEKVRIPNAASRFDDYPHQFSGGMRQRVMIAMALASRPRLLIADEPTTALDVTIQAQILELMKALKQTLGMSIMLITHDLGVVAEMAERVVVMYGGRVVESADVVSLFARPGHPYTEGLLNAIPRMDVEAETLTVIEGNVPNPRNLPKGCRFHPRCPYAVDICREQEPELAEVMPGRRVACHFAAERLGAASLAAEGALAR